jgi:gamma-glutamylputrescine oxidase
MSNLPFWLDPTPDRRTSLQQDIEVDVAIIGGGLCGVSCAYYLTKAGINCCLLESRGIAYSATGRNAGFILQGTAERYNRAIGLMGREKARKIHSYSIENHHLIREIIEEHNIKCEYQKRGSLQLAGSIEEERELLESAALLNEDGFSAVLWDKEILPDIYTNAGFGVGVHLPEDGELNPAQFVQATASIAEENGLTIYENTTVLSMDDDIDPILHTENGNVKAQVIIVCTNARIGEIVPWCDDKISPVRGQMLSTEPAPQIFSCPIYADHGYDYWRQTPDGRIVLGGWRNLDPKTEIGHQEILHEEIQQQMHRFLKRFDPLRDIQITNRWSGIMAFSQDGLPILGALPGTSTILVGTGFTGHGFGFACLAGKGLAETLLEGRHPFIEELHTGRFL